MAASMTRCKQVCQLLGKASQFRAVQQIITSFYSNDERLSKFSYWRKRYQEFGHQSFDWFLDSSQILDIILAHLDLVYRGVKKTGQESIQYLDVGCGTSDLACSIFKDSPVPINLIMLDYVREALQYQTQEMSACAPSVTSSRWAAVCADVTYLPFHDNSFHLTIDKGTMDALLKDRKDGHADSQTMLSEVLRTLTPGGRLIQVSDEDPDTRLLFLEQLSQNCKASGMAGNELGCDSKLETTYIRNSEQLSTVKTASPRENKIKTTYIPISEEVSPNESHHQSEVRKPNCEQRKQNRSAGIMDFSTLPECTGSVQLNSITRGDYPDTNYNSAELSSYHMGANADRSCDHKLMPFISKPHFSSWSFKVVSTTWGSEYFVYWMEKIKS